MANGAKKGRREVGKLVAQAREAVERLAESFDAALRGTRPEPAVVRVRRPTAEELRDYARRRRGY